MTTGSEPGRYLVLRRMSPVKIAFGITSHSAQQPGQPSTHFRAPDECPLRHTASNGASRKFPTVFVLNWQTGTLPSGSSRM